MMDLVINIPDTRLGDGKVRMTWGEGKFRKLVGTT